MIYRCLIHKPTSQYCGQIVGGIDDWSGLAANPDQWAISEVDLNPQKIDMPVDLGCGCVISASRIDPSLLIGGDE